MLRAAMGDLLGHPVAQLISDSDGGSKFFDSVGDLHFFLEREQIGGRRLGAVAFGGQNGGSVRGTWGQSTSLSVRMLRVARSGVASDRRRSEMGWIIVKTNVFDGVGFDFCVNFSFGFLARIEGGDVVGRGGFVVECVAIVSEVIVV